MQKKNKMQELELKGSEAHLALREVNYLGDGVYHCRLLVNSNGFACDRPFDFDNDEYFVSKAWDVINVASGEAELMALESDSYIRLQPTVDEQILVSGYLVETVPLNQSIEFAFTLSRTKAKSFISKFEKMVRANI